MEHPRAGSLLPRFVASIAAPDVLDTLDSAALINLEAELETVQLAAGETLFRQGDSGDGMYVLTRGRLGVRINHPDGTETVVDELVPEVSVGEMALLTGQARAATVYALDSAELVRLSKAGFDRLVAKYPTAMQALAHTILPRLQRTQLAGILTDLFGPLDTAALHDLQAALVWLRLPGGTTLFRQGDQGDALYIVVNGCLRIVLEQDGGERVLGEARRGASVGEFALLTGEPRSATVYASRDTDVVKLAQADFIRVLEHYPRAAIRIAGNIARGARLALRQPAAGVMDTMAFALVPTGDDVPLAAVARRLVETLEGLGPTLHLSSERFDRALGGAGVAQVPDDHPTGVAILGWLGEQERQHRYIVYEADPGWSGWTQRCVRQTDRLLMVGRAGGSPMVGALETAVQAQGTRARMELVLVQPDQIERPTGTRQWLARRRVHAHYHVRLNSDEDFRRLARRLTGRAIGLVLSGGGARGFAHIGAVRALEEAGLAVDLIGGTSMGALIGANLALGAGYQGLGKLAERFSSRTQLLDPTLPLVSFFATRKLTDVLRALVGDVEFEDLWRPFFCVSTNLTQATPIVHQDGSVWRSLRASAAVPGMFAPLLHDGDVLVDGGVMNNLPLDVLRDRYECGLVIAVNASPFRDRAETYAFGPSLSGWQLLWSRLNPAAKRIRAPSLFATLMRVTEVSTVYRTSSQSFRRLADLFIHVPVERFGIVEFERYPEIIAAGYQVAREQIAAWLSDQTPGTLAPIQERRSDVRWSNPAGDLCCSVILGSKRGAES